MKFFARLLLSLLGGLALTGVAAHATTFIFRYKFQYSPDIITGTLTGVQIGDTLTGSVSNVQVQTLAINGVPVSGPLFNTSAVNTGNGWGPSGSAVVWFDRELNNFWFGNYDLGSGASAPVPSYSFSLLHRPNYIVAMANNNGGSIIDLANGTWTLAEAIAPVITSHPVGMHHLKHGASVTLAVSATGSPSPSFQWRRNGVVIPGANASTLTIHPVTIAHAGTYVVEVANGVGEPLVSQAAVVNVTGSAGNDFNGDGHSDLLWRNTRTGEVAVWFFNGASFAGSASLGTVSLDWQSIGAGDFNQDGKADLLWRNFETGEVAIWFMDGALFAGSASFGTVSLEWKSAGMGDFNHDGHTDLLWRHAGTGQVAVWFMDQSLFAGSASVGTVALEWQEAGTGDFNLDGNADLLWYNLSSGQVAVWFMDGATFAGSASLGFIAPVWKNAGTGDFNHDGYSDLLWRNSETGEIAAWLMDRTAFAGSVSVGHAASEWQSLGY